MPALKNINRARRMAYRNQTAFDFPKVWGRVMLVSVLLLLISVGSFFFRGLNLGIEFEGGVSWELSSLDASTADIRDALREVDFADARIQELGSGTYRIRAEVQETNTAQVEQVEAALLANLPGLEADNISFSAVGPSWGDEITNTTRTALIVFLALIALYVWLRMELRMTAAAIAALVHDVVVTVGFYSLFQLEVTPATAIAFLTILGYSLYDTLVVFDKIRDNEKRLSIGRKHTYTQLVNLSVNQVFMRSVNTTITSVLPVLSLLLIGSFVLGAVTLQEFAIALLVGLLAGTYSSLFIATPITAWLKEREEYWILVRERLETYATAGGADGVDGDKAGSGAAAIPSTAAALKSGPDTKRVNQRHRITQQSQVRISSTHPPRPRKKKK